MPDCGEVHVDSTDWNANMNLDDQGRIMLAGVHIVGETLKFNNKIYSCADDGLFYEQGVSFSDETCKTKVTITKSNDEKQYVFGWASVALNADGSIPFEWQGDIIPVDEIENMAYSYVEFYGQSGEEHKGPALGKCIESMAFTPEKIQALGIPEGVLPYGWWIGFHIPDKDVWAKIKSGQYKQFSIQGTARRLSLD